MNILEFTIVIFAVACNVYFTKLFIVSTLIDRGTWRKSVFELLMVILIPPFLTWTIGFGIFTNLRQGLNFTLAMVIFDIVYIIIFRKHIKKKTLLIPLFESIYQGRELLCTVLDEEINKIEKQAEESNGSSQGLFLKNRLWKLKEIKSELLKLNDNYSNISNSIV